jgi:biopolymer transport protein ExbD
MSAKSPLGGGLFGKDSQVYDVWLNLTPLMDVMSNILFFLLAAFGTSIIAIFPTTVPVQTEGSTDIAKEEKSVTISVRADDQGMQISCENAAMTPESLKDCGGFVAKKGDDYDYDNFTTMLVRIKKAYPDSKSMIFVPDETMQYQVVVKIMDASRNKRFSANEKLELFPEVVLSGLVTGEVGPGGAPAAPGK